MKTWKCHLKFLTPNKLFFCFYVKGSRRASLLAQWLRIHLPMQETQETRIRSMAWDDPLEEGTATYSSILSWRIPWTEEPGGLQSIESERVWHDWSDLADMHASLPKGYICYTLSSQSRDRTLQADSLLSEPPGKPLALLALEQIIWLGKSKEWKFKDTLSNWKSLHIFWSIGSHPP